MNLTLKIALPQCLLQNFHKKAQRYNDCEFNQIVSVHSDFENNVPNTTLMAQKKFHCTGFHFESRRKDLT